MIQQGDSEEKLFKVIVVSVIAIMTKDFEKSWGKFLRTTIFVFG